MRIKDKIAIVTGSGRGIGEAIVTRFVKEGAKVVLCDVDENALKDVEGKLKEMGGECILAVGDVSDPVVVKNMVDETVKTFGDLDIMVNNAAITRDAILHKMSDEQWDQVMAVNLKGSFNCLKNAAVHMRQQGKGTIINISSTARYGNIGQLNYSASKGGVVAMTRTAAKELARKNVTCNCISPGTIWTDMMKTVPEKVLDQFRAGVPLGRFGEPKEIANLCLFLASDEASYITGQTINCDGGSFPD
jgi:NAD(P)-dependent dehydrogenase (short-subunit alcohol dehydrogenase family)